MRSETCPEVYLAEAFLQQPSEKYYFVSLPSVSAEALLKGLQREQQRDNLVRSTNPSLTEKPDNLNTVLLGRVQKAVEATDFYSKSIGFSLNGREYAHSIATLLVESQLPKSVVKPDSISDLQTAFHEATLNGRKEEWKQTTFKLPLSVPAAQNLAVFLTELISSDEIDFNSRYADEGIPFYSPLARPLQRIHTATRKTPYSTNGEPVKVLLEWNDNDMEIVGKRILRDAQLVDVSCSNGPMIRKQFAALDTFIQLYKARREQNGAELPFFPDIEIEAEKRRNNKAVTQPTQTPSFPWHNQ